jgi:HAD superfamily hydrolase (TIGR01549 family)
MVNAKDRLANIKAIFFDLYNTLACFSPTREEIQAEACAAFGYTVTPEGIGRGYLKADAFMAAEKSKRQVGALAAERGFFAEYERLVLEGAGVDVPSSTALSIWDRVREIPYVMTLYNDVAHVLPRLRSAGYTIGIISNMSTSGQQLAQDMHLDLYADFVVTSGDVGQGKPHAPIYLASLARANVDADQALHVGDSISADVEGAMAAGIRAIYMNRYPDIPPEGALPEGVTTVHTLADVASLLGL